MPKIHVNFKVDKEVYEEFKELVFQIYGRLYGVLGDEATKALKLWIEKHRGATDIEGEVKVNKRQIKLLRFLYEFDEITNIDLEGWIRENIGIDKRTIRNYMEFLIKNELITKRFENKKITIYRVNKEKIGAILKRNGVDVQYNNSTNVYKDFERMFRELTSLLDALEEEAKNSEILPSKLVLAYISKMKESLGISKKSCEVSVYADIRV